jgi:putative ABC transport system permease protein
MKLIETLKLALAAIWAHKLRSALTLLGMIIGVAAVVVVV